MKQIQRKLTLLLLAFALILAAGCESEETTLEFNDLPSEIGFFFNQYLPGKTPENIRTQNQEDAPYNRYAPYYIITTADGVELGFSKEGCWYSTVSTTEDPLTPPYTEVLSTEMAEYVEIEFSGRSILSINKTTYGNSVTLSDMQKLGLRLGQDVFMGFDYTTNENQQLEKLKDFVYTHFPEAKIDYYTEYNGDKLDEAKYYIGTSNDYSMEFDSYGNWTIVDGRDQLIPESLIEELPAKLLKEINALYQNVQISYIQRTNDTDYTVRVSKTQLYSYKKHSDH